MRLCRGPRETGVSSGRSSSRGRRASAAPRSGISPSNRRRAPRPRRRARSQALSNGRRCIRPRRRRVRRATARVAARQPGEPRARVGRGSERTSSSGSGWRDRTSSAQTRSSFGARSDLDPVRPRLAPDLGAPRLDVVNVLGSVDHLVARRQFAVVVVAIDARDDAVDASPDVQRSRACSAPR